MDGNGGGKHSASSSAKKRIAFVVGIGDYSKKLPELDNAPSDARGIAEALESIGFDVKLFIDKPFGVLDEAFCEFCYSIDSDTIVFVYFACHGIEYQGTNYLIPVISGKIRANRARENLLSLQRMQSEIDAQRPRLGVLVADACRSNISPDELFERLDKKDDHKRRGVNGRGGFASMTSTGNMFLAFSCAPGQEAIDGLDGETNSPFAKHLMHFVKQPMSITEVFMNVRRSVYAETETRQRPWESHSLMDPIFLVEPHKATRPPPLLSLGAITASTPMRGSPAKRPLEDAEESPKTKLQKVDHGRPLSLHELLELCKSDPVLNRAAGCMLAAALGDAMGSTLRGDIPSKETVALAMKLQGGGAERLTPGQFTDHTELAMCLAEGLIVSLEKSKRFDADWVARQYSRWFHAKPGPFGVGQTCMNAFGSCRGLEPKEGPLLPHEPAGEWARTMTEVSASKNRKSLANGSLMRCFALGVFGRQLEAGELARLAVTDSKLSHPNELCCDTSAAYAIALAQLINGAEAAPAFKTAKDWAESKSSDVSGFMNQRFLRVPYTPNDGHVRIAFSHALRHVLNRTPFLKAMEETLLGGGDTTSNASIVAAMIGAARGLTELPLELLRIVVNRPANPDLPRPDFVAPERLPSLIHKLFVLSGREPIN